MENPAYGAPPLVAAPRHLRRRRLHGDIPDWLLVPGARPLPRAPKRPPAAERPATAKRAAELDMDDAEVTYSRKRLTALVAVIVVVIAVPALVIALLLLG
ncbi:hypothetical protein ACQCSU_04110 [Pseudarthrobacter sp. O4]|uniref:hypothetical protein n=1 Tax=Pseudarthrobacter sp. O4 TaxID=3418417 RepID=UPI003CF64214